MSWFSALPTGAATRQGNLEAREQRRAEIEAERLLKKQKSEQRRQLLALGVSAPPSPSLSRAPTPTNDSERVVESEPTSPSNMSLANQGGGGGSAANSNNNQLQQPPPVGPGGPGAPPGGGPPGPPGGGPPGGGPPGGPNPPVNGGGNPNDQAQINAEIDYDLLDTQDTPRAIESSGRTQLIINLEDISFWFSELESEMLLAGVGSQWLKLSVLRKNLPVKQREDVKSLLRLKKSEAGPTPYYDVKMALIKLYELKPKDTFKKALGRVLTGLPSQLGNQIVDDICTKPIKLRGCCCAKAANALWTNQLPVHINQHISNMEFTADTYKQVFDAADRVFMSSKSVTSVAAITKAAAQPGFSITEGENSPLNTAFHSATEVAAVSKPKKNKKNKNKNNNAQETKPQGGQQNSQNSQSQGQGQRGRRGPRHSSNPPHTCCDVHFTHGDGAWFCGAPLRCPWKDRVVERP